MTYRIIELTLGDGWGEVRIQCKGWWRWHTIWKHQYASADTRDYVLLCAEEIKEQLETEI